MQVPPAARTAAQHRNNSVCVCVCITHISHRSTLHSARDAVHDWRTTANRNRLTQPIGRQRVARRPAHTFRSGSRVALSRLRYSLVEHAAWRARLWRVAHFRLNNRCSLRDQKSSVRDPEAEYGTSTVSDGGDASVTTRATCMFDGACNFVNFIILLIFRIYRFSKSYRTSTHSLPSVIASSTRLTSHGGVTGSVRDACGVARVAVYLPQSAGAASSS